MSEPADLSRTIPDDDALGLVDADTARRLQAVPLRLDGDVLEVAVAAPDTDDLTATLEKAAGHAVKLTEARPDDVDEAINRSYRLTGQILRLATAAASSTRSEEPAVGQLVDLLVTQACRDRASDLHLEPRDDGLHVRVRVDGRLRQILTLPVEIAPKVTSRIKVLASMNILERRRCQDGHFRTSVDGRDLDVRVATAPTVTGEKTVLRLLERTRTVLQLPSLGMNETVYERMSDALATPHGMVLCTGPTGAGKTTTLYAALAEITDPEVNVETVEDPVEYTLDGINQIEVDPDAGVTFSSGLRGILRQDPDIILVGEIRDAETADIAVQASLSGHFVLSSFHATDAVGALHRLLQMRVESFLVASSLRAVVGQRLVRKVCDACAVERDPTDAETALLARLSDADPPDTVRAGEGCSRCGHTGFHGRTGVFELLVVSNEMRALLASGAGYAELRAQAEADGMVGLEPAAAALVAAGVTTADEVAAQVGDLGHHGKEDR